MREYVASLSMARLKKKIKGKFELREEVKSDMDDLRLKGQLKNCAFKFL